MKDTTTHRRNRWLRKAKAITYATIARSNIIRSGCVTATLTDDINPDDQQILIKTTRQIHSARKDGPDESVPVGAVGAQMVRPCWRVGTDQIGA